MIDMPDLYEQWASETLSIANQQRRNEADWRDAYEEIASELLSLANTSRRESPDG